MGRSNKPAQFSRPAAGRDPRAQRLRLRDGYGHYLMPPIVEKHMEKKMENELETGIIRGIIGIILEE